MMRIGVASLARELDAQMTDSSLILGEFRRTLDDRFRLSIPPELIEKLDLDNSEAVLVKERPGCLSLWRADAWKAKLESNIQIIESKVRANRMSARSRELQTLGRLLSTRHRDVALAGRNRLVIPEGFREFILADPGSDVLVVGAAVCIEIWRVEAWRNCLDEQIPNFADLLEELAQ